MKSIFLAIFLLVFYWTVNNYAVKNIGRSLMIETRSRSKIATAYVVNLEYCFSCIITEEHQVETLDKICSYANLLNVR